MPLASARYGKDLVRVLRVVRGEGGKDGVHDVAEYNIRALVEGDLTISFTEGDNSVVVATDSIKNMVYYLAKTSPHVLSPERFATHIGVFILSRYAHLTKAFIDVERLKWTRINVGEHAIGKDAEPGALKAEDGGHRHSFQRDGEEKHVVKVEVSKVAGQGQGQGRGQGEYEVRLEAGLVDLLVLKSSGSAFTGFVRDEFTTLVEVNDRIFSTAVEMSYTFPTYYLKEEEEEGRGGIIEGLTEMEKTQEFATAARLARKITLDLFATHDSASVQATLYRMGEALIAEHPKVATVSYVLPNKHYIPVDMKYIGIENMREDAAEVFMPVSAPSGRIVGTVSRE